MLTPAVVQFRETDHRLPTNSSSTLAAIERVGVKCDTWLRDLQQFTEARPVNGTRRPKGQKWTKFQLVLFDVLKPGNERPYLVKGLIPRVGQKARPRVRRPVDRRYLSSLRGQRYVRDPLIGSP